MKKKTYWKLVASFSCIIALSVASGVIIYSNIYQTLEKEIVASNSSSLTQLSSQFDAKIQNAAAFFSNVSLNQEVNRFILQDTTSESYMADIYKTHRILKSMMSSETADLFIYYKNQNRIVSAVHTAFQTEKYYTAYYKKSQFDFSLFQDSLDDVNIMSVKSFGSPCELAVIQSIPYNDLKNPSATLVYIPDKANVTNMLDGARYCEDSAIIILNREGEIVSSAGIGNHLLRQIDFNHLDATSDCYRQAVQGKDYIFQVVYSQSSGCRFISLVPVSLFWSRLESIRIYITITTVAYLLFGGWFSLLLSRKNYQPISTLIRDINEKVTNVAKPAVHDEMDYIRSVLNNAFTEKEQYIKIRQEEFLNKALQGIYPKSGNLFTEFKMAGIQLLSDRFIVILFHFDIRNRTEKSYLYNQTLFFESVLYETLKNNPSGEYRSFLLSHTRNTWIGLINPAGEYTEENTLELCRNMQSELKNKVRIPFTMAFSSLYDNWSGMERACKEAESVLQYRSVFGTGSILPFSIQTTDSKRYYDFDWKESVEQSAYLYITGGESTPEEWILKTKEEVIHNGIRTPREYDFYFYSMNSLFTKIADEIGIGEEKLYELNFCETLSELDEQLANVLREFRTYYMENVSNKEEYEKEKEICDQVMEYVRQNYTDVNLSVGKIGQDFNLTSSYLSKRFKNFTGVSIFDYLVGIRIEKAKELLVSTEDSIEKIAIIVGFLSSAALIRAFKKTEDMTPGSYRKIHKGRQVCKAENPNRLWGING